MLVNERKIKSELRWLAAMDIERDNNVPLYLGQPKTRGKYVP